MTDALQIDPDAAHILVVDDEGAIRYSIGKTLQKMGYQVSAAASGEEALKLISEQSFDVILSDIRMPGLTGVELLARIKDIAPEAVVILMTGYASMGTAIESLRLGAHDYLIKPSSNSDIRMSVQRGLERARDIQRHRVLLTEIQHNLKELTGGDTNSHNNAAGAAAASNAPTLAPSAPMTLGPLTIYPGRYEIKVADKTIPLTPTEFDLLLYLAAHRGRVVPCLELVREVRGYAVEESEAREVIRPHISNLRRKLEKTGQDPDLIMNVRGIGYRLADPNEA